MNVSEKILVEFDGFGNSAGKCYMKAISTDNKIIAVCIQAHEYYGTSITNALERIVGQFEIAVLNDKFGQDIANHYKKLVDEHKRSRDLLSKIKDFFMQRVLRRVEEYGKIWKFLMDGDVLWLEVYPPGTGIIDKKYSIHLVRFGDLGEPSWGRALMEEDLIKLFGITIEKVR